METLKELKSMPYEEYLLTKHWKSFREGYLKRHANKCMLCASEEKISLHHNSYENRGKETDDDVILLCDKCHKRFHKIICYKINREERKKDTSPGNRIKIYEKVKNMETNEIQEYLIEKGIIKGTLRYKILIEYELERYGKENLAKAIAITVDNNVKSHGYLESIIIKALKDNKEIKL